MVLDCWFLAQAAKDLGEKVGDVEKEYNPDDKTQLRYSGTRIGGRSCDIVIMAQILKIFSLMLVMVFLTPAFIFAQREEWSCLIPLKSTRAEVERILGKPAKYFDTSGGYETSYGKYSVWYATGRCSKKVEGRDWNVDAGIMTNLLVYPKRVDLIDQYLSNLQDYERRESPGGYSRFLYLSKDESLIYQTIKRPDSTEFIYAIALEPGKDKENLLCSSKKD